MLSTVLNSERVIQVNIEIRRAFVRLSVQSGKRLERSGALERLEPLERTDPHDESKDDLGKALKSVNQ